MDPSEHVRQALASVMNDMSPVLGNDNTINHLLPMLLTLLRDTNPDVRWDKTLFDACIFFVWNVGIFEVCIFELAFFFGASGFELASRDCEWRLRCELCTFELVVECFGYVCGRGRGERGGRWLAGVNGICNTKAQV